MLPQVFITNTKLQHHLYYGLIDYHFPWQPIYNYSIYPTPTTNMSNLDHLQKRCKKKSYHDVYECIMPFQMKPQNHKQNLLAFLNVFLLFFQVEVSENRVKSWVVKPNFSPFSPWQPDSSFSSHPWHLPFWINGTCCRRLSLLSKDSEARRFTVLSRGSAFVVNGAFVALEEELNPVLSRSAELRKHLMVTQKQW